jgi:predicted ATP-dependent endonuclease of OLD family
MPTYRRIEKDIQTIFPDIEDRLRARLDEHQISARAGVHFQEIVSFGMEDISSIILAFTNSVKELQRQQTEGASQEYIRDIVRGQFSESSLKGIRELSEDRVKDFIDRLDVNLFTPADRESLKKKISDIRGNKGAKPKKDQQYLGLFVEKLLAAHNSVKEQERPLLDFTNYISKYLGNNKRAIYQNFTFRIEDSQSRKELRLNDLSSGEKQIISIFAYLLLSKERDYILFIDEPELSLSVPWQKAFLPDLLATERCQHLFSVTHSPFVFDNDLRNSVVDVERLKG